MSQQRSPDSAYLGSIVLAFRENVGMSQQDVAQRGGPSDTTQSQIEAGTWSSSRPQKTLEKIDQGFNWTPGTSRRIAFDRWKPDFEAMPPIVVEHFFPDYEIEAGVETIGLQLRPETAAWRLDTVTRKLLELDDTLNETRQQIAQLQATQAQLLKTQARLLTERNRLAHQVEALAPEEFDEGLEDQPADEPADPIYGETPEQIAARRRRRMEKP